MVYLQDMAYERRLTLMHSYRVRVFDTTGATYSRRGSNPHVQCSGRIGMRVSIVMASTDGQFCSFRDEGIICSITDMKVAAQHIYFQPDTGYVPVRMSGTVDYI